MIMPVFPRMDPNKRWNWSAHKDLIAAMRQRPRLTSTGRNMAKRVRQGRLSHKAFLKELPRLIERSENQPD